MAKRGAPRGKRSTALGLLAALAAVAAGCGGGGGGGGGDSDSTEAASRKQLESAAAKVADAKSMRLSLQFEVEMDGTAEEIGCMNLALDTGKPERFDLTFFDLECAGGSEGHELVAVGNRAWASTEPGYWTAAKITPELIHELDDEQTELDQLFAGAENIEAGSDEGGEDDPVGVTTYAFEAPASAFPNTSSEVADLQVEFSATVDGDGYLRELVVHGDEDGAGATVTEKFDDLDEPLAISPPDPDEVEGPVTTIDSRDELESLFGFPTS